MVGPSEIDQTRLTQGAPSDWIAVYGWGCRMDRDRWKIGLGSEVLSEPSGPTRARVRRVGRIHVGRPRFRAARAHGQAIVELALILPVMLVLVAGAIDLGRVFYSTITLANAAREGVLEAAADPTSFVAGAPCDKVTNSGNVPCGQ